MNPILVQNGYRFAGLAASQAKAAAQQKTVLLFGGTKGIGRGVANALDEFDAKRVVVVGRSFDGANSGSKIQFVKADLSLMSACKGLVGTHEQVLRDADEVVFTVGILTDKKRQETSEKLEEDMAISYLSRLLIIDKLADLKQKGAVNPKQRVWVMGFPGVLKASETKLLDDLNAETKYEQFPQHMKTVLGNECIVHHYRDRLSIFGLNPGLVSTNIRTPVLGNGILFKFVEAIISSFNTSAAAYGKRLAELMVSEDFEKKAASGMLLNQKFQEIKKCELCTDENVQRVMKESKALIDRALASHK